MYQTISEDRIIQQKYVDMRRNGQSHAIAEMLAFNQPPDDFSCDRRFMADLKPFKGTPKEELAMRKAMKKAGVHVGEKVYLGGLANKRHDPRALVSSLDDVKRLAQERKMRIESNGRVLVDTLGDPEPDMPDPGVCPKIVERRVREHEARTGVRLTGKARTDMKEKIFNRAKPSFSKAKFQGK